MEKKEELPKVNQSESEDELDDTELLDDKPQELQKQPTIEKKKTPDINIEKINQLRKKFRDKEFLVKGN